MTEVGGADDKVVVVFFDKSRIPFGEMGLQTQFHAEKQRDFTRVFFAEFQKVVEIGVRVHLKKPGSIAFGHRIVKVVVFRKAHFGKPQFDPPEDHLFHGCVGIPRKGGM